MAEWLEWMSQTMTWNELLWSEGHGFEPRSSQTWCVQYFCLNNSLPHIIPGARDATNWNTALKQSPTLLFPGYALIMEKNEFEFNTAHQWLATTPHLRV